jgi:hypothetical protein
VAVEDEETQAGIGPVAGRFGRRSSVGRWVWLGSFALLAGLMLIRSSFLFTTRLYETADEADNSILVVQAEHFALLHGNYSREGFFHPGPAYLYVMAAGQWLFHDATHLVPTPWNGQLVAILLLNSALMATVAWIVYSWARSVWAAVAAVALIVGLAAAVDVGVPEVINRNILAASWMPDVYVPTFLAFLVAAASVAAGRTSHLWLLAATGWLLIHGHVAFLYFVPLIMAATAAAALWPTRRAPWAAIWRFLRHRWPHYLPAMLISAVFALPIAADLILHWPGQFGMYVRYARSAKAGHHTVGEAIRYVLWYWAPGPLWLAILVTGIAVAAGLAVAAAVPSLVTASPASLPLQRFLLAATWVGAATTAGMIYYVMRGVDDLNAAYIGFFYWSVPLLTFLVAATGLTAARQGRGIAKVAVAGALVVALGSGAASPGLRADVHDNEPALFTTMTALAASAHGRLIVLQVGDFTEFDADGLVLQAERLGARACLAGPSSSVFEVTIQFICRPPQESTGVTYWLHRLPYSPVAGVRVIARLRYAVLTARQARHSR